jgi:hypothetical protein
MTLSRRTLDAVARYGATAARPVWRRRRVAFADRPAPVVVHCAHHKVGTVWFKQVLSSVFLHYGLRFGVVAEWGEEPASRWDGVFYDHAHHFARSHVDGRPFRGTHMVRDPRDVAVSAFHYHLWSSEPWLHEPRSEFGGKTYQGYLKSLPPDEGLAAEIRRSAETSIKEMADWDYAQPEFLELHYEDVFGNERAIFRRVFDHYGFTSDAAEWASRRADAFSFNNRADQAKRADGKSHLRSGTPGGWREAFGPEHVRLFDEVAGTALTKLGYE